MNFPKNVDLLPIAAGIIAILAAFPILNIYIIPSFTWGFYYLLIGSSINLVHQGKTSYRFALFSVCLLIGFVFLKVKVLYLTGLLFFLLFLVEQRRGIINIVPAFGVFLLTPLSQYFVSTFSFPLRLEMTTIAAKWLTLIQKDTIAVGNIIKFDNVDFTVDEVCMGLNFFQIGLILCLVLIAIFERQRKLAMTSWQVSLWLCIALTLILVANFLRIITIVLFRAFPNTLEHEVIGLTCFVGYVIVPLFVCLKWFAIYSIPFSNQPDSSKKMTQFPLSVISLIPFLTFFIFSALFSAQLLTRPKTRIPDLTPASQHYQVHQMKDGIMQYSNDSILVYVKPGVPFYAAEHSIRVCWKGSGYTILNEIPTSIHNQPVIFSELSTPENTKLYSYSWFSNGQLQTISQWKWRKAVLNGGAPFHLVNVVGTSKEELQKEVLKWMNQ